MHIAIGIRCARRTGTSHSSCWAHTSFLKLSNNLHVGVRVSRCTSVYSYTIVSIHHIYIYIFDYLCKEDAFEFPQLRPCGNIIDDGDFSFVVTRRHMVLCIADSCLVSPFVSCSCLLLMRVFHFRAVARHVSMKKWRKLERVSDTGEYAVSVSHTMGQSGSCYGGRDRGGAKGGQ